MTITEVATKYDMTTDTLRYYEKVGIIPRVHRTKSGLRDYDESDIGWVEHAKCMRAAGLPVEALIEYLRLYQLGDSTFKERRDLLKKQKEILIKKRSEIDETIERLEYKIDRYDEAVESGVLKWDKKEKNQ